MTDDLLPQTSFQDVRYAIDQRLTKTSLPDAMIASRVYRDRAIRYVTQRVPGYVDGDPIQTPLMIDAVTLYCASLLILAIVDETSIKISVRDSQYSKPAWNPEDKEKSLKDEASELIDYINNAIIGGQPLPPIQNRLTSLFTTKPGGRMRGF